MTAEFLKGDEDYFASVLASVLETKFTPHELEEQVLPTIQTESSSALQDPAIAALEAAHVLAFRSGLATPLYWTAGAHGVTSADARAYAQKVFGSDVAIIGTGISQEALEKLVSKHFSTLSSSGSTTSDVKTAYHGGESRLPSPPHSNGSALFIGKLHAPPS
jgi:ubiquinol-cytochrome c reductase core subunit 2